MAENKKGSKHFDFTKDSNSGGGRFDFTKDEPEKSHVQKYGKWYICGAVGLACLAAIVFWSKNQGEGSVTPPVDTLTHVVDSPAVEKIDTTTNVENITPVNEGVDKKQNEVSTETPEMRETPNVNTATESNPAGNSRRGDVTAEAMKSDSLETATTDVVSVPKDIEKAACSVIRGTYGNNPQRRRLLKERYQEIQNKVNEMYRNGLVK